jgi:transcriptional regulator with XRE-family HTH domain
VAARGTHGITINVERELAALSSIVLVIRSRSRARDYALAVDQDWAGVSRAMSARLLELGMTQTELAAKAQVSLTTVREVVHNLNARRRNPRTLAALAVALGWPEDGITRLLRGDPPVGGAASERRDAVVAELQALREQLLAMQGQLDSLREEVARPGQGDDLDGIKAALIEITERLAAIEKR